MYIKIRTIKIMLLGILFLVIAAGVATFVYFSPIPAAQAAPSLDQTYPDPQNPDATYRVCTISDIGAISTHIHVYCTTAEPAGVNTYAYSSEGSNAAIANRFLALMNTALALGKPVHFRYLTTGTQPAWCPPASCRILNEVWIKP